MADNIGSSTARLEGLVARAMKEKDLAKYDELCSELWLVLEERERLTGTEAGTGGANTTSA